MRNRFWFGNHDQGVDVLLQLGQPALGDAHPMGALEMERLGHHADRQDALLAHRARDHRRRPGAGTATHAGGDEHHVAALQLIEQLLDRLLRGGAADLRARARAQALRDRGAQLDSPLGERLRQRLGIGIAGEEFHAFEMRRDHVVHGIGSGTTHADHADPWS